MYQTSLLYLRLYLTVLCARVPRSATRLLFRQIHGQAGAQPPMGHQVPRSNGPNEFPVFHVYLSSQVVLSVELCGLLHWLWLRSLWGRESSLFLNVLRMQTRLCFGFIIRSK